MNAVAAGHEPTRAELDRTRGPMVVEFGSSWCGICRAAQPAIAAARAAHPQLPHVQVEDGPGRPLGRSFGVKLWPTLVFMHDGREVARLVRPRGREVADAFVRLAERGEGGESKAADEEAAFNPEVGAAQPPAP